MSEEIKKSNQSEESSQPQAEKVDNRIPYEKPLLRKHGKVNGDTNTIPVLDGQSFDRNFGLDYADAPPIS